ncbi:MAG: contractile injection system tape measure protein [Chitinophagaceae bacterium]
MVTDAINIQAFEFSCKTEEVAREIQLEIEYSISFRINQIISSVLQENAGPGTHLKIDKIEINLGDITLEDFGKTEMLFEFEELFKQKIIAVKHEDKEGQNKGKAGKTANEFELIRSLLLHGDVPWWADKNSVIPVDAILQKMIKLYPQSLKQFLEEHREKMEVLIRIAEQCKPSTRSMIEQLIPGISVYKSKSLFREYPGKLSLRLLTPARLLQLKSILNTYNQTPVYKLRRSLFTGMVTGNNLALLTDFLSGMGFTGVSSLLIIKEGSSTGPGNKKQRGIRNELKLFIKRLSVFQIEFLLSQLALMQELKRNDGAVTTSEIGAGVDLLPGDGYSGTDYNRAPGGETAQIPSNQSAQHLSPVFSGDDIIGVNSNFSNKPGRDNSSEDINTREFFASDKNDFSIKSMQGQSDGNADKVGDNDIAIPKTTTDDVKENDKNTLPFSETEKSQEPDYLADNQGSGPAGKLTNDDKNNPSSSDAETLMSAENENGLLQSTGDNTPQTETQFISGQQNIAPHEIRNIEIRDAIAQIEAGNNSIEEGGPQRKLQDAASHEIITRIETPITGVQDDVPQNESANTAMPNSMESGASQIGDVRDEDAGISDIISHTESGSSGEPQSSNIKDKNLSDEQEINKTSDEQPENRQISFILRTLHVNEPTLIQYLQKLEENDLNNLVESFKNHIRENRDRRKMINQVLDHPFLLKYKILDIFSSLSFDDDSEQPPGLRSSVKKKDTQKENILSSYAKKIQLSQSDFISFINKLSLKELVILKDIFQKEQFDSSQEKRIVRKILYKLPGESILLIKYLTELSEEEIKHLFSAGHNTTAISNLPGNSKKNIFYDNKGVEKIIVENAGLCLIANYLPGFFKRMGYLENKLFKNKGIANRALYILQNMVTGNAKSPEYLLQLNKLLCGFDVADTIIGSIRLTKKEIEEADNLLSSVIENWKQLKSTSLDGFRGSFLQRKGILFQKESSWTLQVEKKGYDLLLNTIPWGFGLIKLPWMKKHIMVEW